MNTINDWSSKRHHLNLHTFRELQFSKSPYCTQTLGMKNTLREDILENIILSDPLQMKYSNALLDGTKTNMATTEKQKPNDLKERTKYKSETLDNNKTFHPFAGLGSFFSNVFSVVTNSVFQRRAKSPVQFYDCFEMNFDKEKSVDIWQSSKVDDQNKIERAREKIVRLDSCDIYESDTDMGDCRAAAVNCEDKLKKVRQLLTKPIKITPQRQSKRPRKIFVEAGSIEEKFEDAFSPEDFNSFKNNMCLECSCLGKHQEAELMEVAAPKIKIEMPFQEKNSVDTSEIVSNVKVVSTCEDKMNKMNNESMLGKKLSLNEKQNLENIESGIDKSMVGEEVIKDVNHVNPPIATNTKKENSVNRKKVSDKHTKLRMKRNIQDDMNFANEIDSEEFSSSESSPRFSIKPKNMKKKDNSRKEGFNEIKGRFRSSSTTESEDSFQIVFSDSPSNNRDRKVSDCDSEDSFIVFEDTPENCYTSTDVFNDGTSSSDIESESSDCESDSDIECGTMNLTCNLSRTVGDLTDDSLYEDEPKLSGDEVDCAVRTVCEEIPEQEISLNPEEINKKPGLLLNTKRKLQKKKEPPKKVHFSPLPPKVHVMRVWTFAARQARAGHWERLVIDRDRFNRRIADVDVAISWVLQPQHRSRVMFQRFMPWWNAQKRQELAEKKLREEQEKLKKEEDLKKEEEKVVESVKDISVSEVESDKNLECVHSGLATDKLVNLNICST